MVIQALAGTTAVMLGAALVAFVTGVNVSFLAPILLIGLIGLIVVGLIGIFVRFSRGVNLVYSVIGMIVFAGFFLFSFARMAKSGVPVNDRTHDQPLPQFRQFLHSCCDFCSPRRRVRDNFIDLEA
jgi:FtsH-binding integral membrane protein